MKIIAKGLLLLSMLFALIATSVAPVAATSGGNTEGCTPGFWKNHTEVWQEYTANQTIGSVFGGSAYGSSTLLQGLNFSGGTGVAGAERILLRAAIASLLNAAYDDGDHLQFPWRRNDIGFNGEPPLIPTVSAALASDDRSVMLSLAAQLDAANNLGCPL